MAEPEKKTAPEPQNEPQKKEGVPEWVTKMQESLDSLPHRLAEAMKPSDPDPEPNDPEKPMEIPVPQPPEPEPQPEPTPADPEPEEKPKKRRFLDWLM